MSSLAEQYPVEQSRCRELIRVYLGLDNGAGTLGAAAIEGVLQEADLALASGDLYRMIEAFEAMKGCE